MGWGMLYPARGKHSQRALRAGSQREFPWATCAWHTLHGCKPLPGMPCAHCYGAEFISHPEAAAVRFPGITVKSAEGLPVFGGRVLPDLKALSQPSRVALPQVIAVNPYSDVMLGPDWYTASTFRVMTEGAYWHIYVLQTRHPLKMVGWLRSFPRNERLWVGLSAWDQASLDRAVDDLAMLPCPNRWLAIKPQLEPVRLPSHIGQAASWLVVAGSRGNVFDWIDPAHIDDTVHQAKALGLPVFLEHYAGVWGQHAPDLPAEVPWTICLPKWLH